MNLHATEEMLILNKNMPVIKSVIVISGAVHLILRKYITITYPHLIAVIL